MSWHIHNTTLDTPSPKKIEAADRCSSKSPHIGKSPRTNSMAKQSTILLGGWAAFSEARGLSKKEEPETFDWMSEENVFFYNDARAALDATPGSREFFRSLKPEESSRGPISDAVQEKMSPMHSGASMSCLIGCYRAALRDWDGWVFASKKHRLLQAYRESRLTLSH